MSCNSAYQTTEIFLASFELSAILDQSKDEELGLVQQNIFMVTIPLLVVKSSPLITQGSIQSNTLQKYSEANTCKTYTEKTWHLTFISSMHICMYS